MIRLDRVVPLAALVACLAAVATVGSSAAAGPTAHASRDCHYQREMSNGYITSLVARHVSCSKAKRVMKAHFSCRSKHHAASACHRVKGYRCSERRNSIPTEIDAKVTCKRGHKRVIYRYQLNT